MKAKGTERARVDGIRVEWDENLPFCTTHAQAVGRRRREREWVGSSECGAGRARLLVP